ncbi:MAG: hypothetical protein WD317_02465 [Balneolaceae bacterium]
MAKKQEMQFAIEAFEIDRFSSSKPEANVRKDRLDYKIQHSFDTNVGKKLVHVTFIIEVLSGKQNPRKLTEIETRTTYKLKGIETDDGLRLPDELIVTFLSIAYSNTRGALAAKAQGTIVGDVPLPLINPTAVVEKMKKGIKQKEKTS